MLYSVARFEKRKRYREGYPQASWYLRIRSRAEASFFSAPADVNLAPTGVARVYFLALLTAVTAIMVSLALAPFLLALLVGRGTRFFLVADVLYASMRHCGVRRIASVDHGACGANGVLVHPVARVIMRARASKPSVLPVA